MRESERERERERERESTGRLVVVAVCYMLVYLMLPLHSLYLGWNSNDQIRRMCRFAGRRDSC